MRASIAVCTHARPELLRRCLASLEGVRWREREVLVIHNDPVEEATRRVAESFGVRYVVEPVKGLNRARRRALRESAGGVVAFIDEDAVAEPEWLDGLLGEFADPRVIAVAGKVRPLSLDSEPERAFAVLHGPELGGPTRTVIDRTTTPHWFEMANFGGIGIGTNMAFRRSADCPVDEVFPVALDRGAPLDQGGDNYAFFAVLSRGHRVVYTPAAVVRHPYPRTAEDLRRKHARDLAASVAYTLYLFAHASAYRWRIVAYLLGALRGRRRPWRPVTHGLLKEVAGADRVIAILRGIAMYLRSIPVSRRAGPHLAH